MKIMMFAHAGSLNRGCEAIVRSSASIIKEKIDGARIYLASGRPHTDRDIPKVDAVYDGTRTEIRKYSLDWAMSMLHYRLLNDESYAIGKLERKVIGRIPEMDVCMSIGGDNYCYGEQPQWYEIDRRVKEQGKKLVLWGCSIGEEDMSEAKLEDLRRFDLILARESLTYQMLRDRGLTNVKRCADPAFTMEKEELPLPAGWQEGNTVGLNFSPLVWKRNKPSQSAVNELIAHILATTDMTVALTPHVTEEGNNDYEILNRYYEAFRNTGRVILLPDTLNAVQYKGYIGRMRFFIGARTHATIAAYSNCVPTMVLGYSVKSKGIARDLFGEEKLVLGIGDIADGGKLVAKWNEMVRDERALRQTLARSIPEIKRLSYAAADHLKHMS